MTEIVIYPPDTTSIAITPPDTTSIAITPPDVIVLQVMDQFISTPIGNAGGDLKGTYPNPLVRGLQGRPMSAANPALYNSIIWNGTEWIPGIPLTISDAGKVDTTRQVLAGTGLIGGGDLTADRIFNINFAANGTSTEAVRSDDSRLTDSRTPTTHTHVLADITDLGGPPNYEESKIFYYDANDNLEELQWTVDGNTYTQNFYYETDGDLSYIEWTRDGNTYRKTFTWNLDGTLASAIITEL